VQDGQRVRRPVRQSEGGELRLGLGHGE
jgi:hypothetical protein